MTAPLLSTLTLPPRACSSYIQYSMRESSGATSCNSHTYAGGSGHVWPGFTVTNASGAMPFATNAAARRAGGSMMGSSVMGKVPQCMPMDLQWCFVVAWRVMDARCNTVNNTHSRGRQRTRARGWRGARRRRPRATGGVRT